MTSHGRNSPRGIQATLFDYFQDTEYFTLQEAEEHVLEHEKLGGNVPSIRARIYEGIDKGLFERVGKGLYTVTRKDEQGRENTCLLINGDGRDLSMFPDNSIDALITVIYTSLVGCFFRFFTMLILSMCSQRCIFIFETF